MDSSTALDGLEMLGIRQFRFKTWRPAVGSGHIGVDEAIDRVGLAKFPNEWGRRPEYDQLPLFRRHGDLYQLKPLQLGSKQFIREKVTNSGPIVATHTNFRKARFALKKVIRDGEVQAVCISPDGAEFPLTDAMMTVQPKEIFGAGYLFRGTQHHRVWIKRGNLRRWIVQNYNREVLEDDELDHFRKVVSQTECKGIARRGLSRLQVEDIIHLWLWRQISKDTVEELLELQQEPVRQTGTYLAEDWPLARRAILAALNSPNVGEKG